MRSSNYRMPLEPHAQTRELVAGRETKNVWGLQLSKCSTAPKEKKMSEKIKPEMAWREQSEPELRKNLSLAIKAVKPIYGEVLKRVQPLYNAACQEYAAIAIAWKHQLPNINQFRRMMGMDRRNFLSARENFAIRKAQLVRVIGISLVDYGRAKERLSPLLESYKNHKDGRHPLHLIFILRQLSTLLVTANKPMLMLVETDHMEERIKEMSEILQQVPNWRGVK